VEFLGRVELPLHTFSRRGNFYKYEAEFSRSEELQLLAYEAGASYAPGRAPGETQVKQKIKFIII
jgi:hypothetical protein